MKYAGGVIRHLGLQMYSGPVPAIAELISNAWDADASEVIIKLPLGEKIGSPSSITVSDNGEGMTWEDFEKKYVIVGRDARKTDGDTTKKLNRKRMAHKGIGKLAGFGIADVVEIISVKNKKETRFSMNYAAIKKLELGEDYVINVTQDNKPTIAKDGTTIILKKLKLKRAIQKQDFFVSMARRFSVLSDKFKVMVNEEILAKEQGPFQIRFPSNHHRVPGERIIRKKGEYEIQGAGSIKYWIGFTEKPIKVSESRGLVVLSRGKLVQDPWFFDISGGVTGQHGMQYMTGEIEADFLDDKTDFITTGRDRVMWSMQVPSRLKEWGIKKVRFTLEKWAEERGKIKMQKIKRAPPYIEKIKEFPTRQRKELESIVNKMASMETIEDNDLLGLVRSLIDVYENKTLTRMIDEISALSPDAQVQLYKIMQEFQILESVSLAQIARSRIRIIEKFEDMLDKGVPEKPDMQNYLKNYPWLIDPSYAGLSHEKRLETILKNTFNIKTKARDKDKRVDFFCLGDSGKAFVVEVKRPKTTVTVKHVRQLVEYVDFLKSENEKETALGSHKIFYGLLIGSRFSDDSKHERRRAHTDGIDTKTWDTLLDTANRSHKEFFNVMKSKVPENDPRIKDFDRYS